MPFALVIIGLIMIVTGAKNTNAALGAQLRSDFTGQGNFTYWFIALGTVGALGSIPYMRGFSRMFMTLIIISLLLSHRGFFVQFQEAIKNGPETPPRPEDNPERESFGSSALGLLFKSPALEFAKYVSQTRAAREKGEAQSNQDLERARGNFGSFLSGLKMFGL